MAGVRLGHSDEEPQPGEIIQVDEPSHFNKMMGDDPILDKAKVRRPEDRHYLGVSASLFGVTWKVSVAIFVVRASGQA